VVREYCPHQHRGKIGDCSVRRRLAALTEVDSQASE
jgi:hypothetical protein